MGKAWGQAGTKGRAVRSFAGMRAVWRCSLQGRAQCAVQLKKCVPRRARARADNKPAAWTPWLTSQPPPAPAPAPVPGVTASQVHVQSHNSEHAPLDPTCLSPPMPRMPPPACL